MIKRKTDFHLVMYSTYMIYAMKNVLNGKKRAEFLLPIVKKLEKNINFPILADSEVSLDPEETTFSKMLPDLFF